MFLTKSLRKLFVAGGLTAAALMAFATLPNAAQAHGYGYGSGSQSARVTYKWVVRYEEQTVAYKAWVVKYAECGTPYRVPVVRTKVVRVPVKTRVAVYY